MQQCCLCSQALECLRHGFGLLAEDYLVGHAMNQQHRWRRLANMVDRARRFQSRRGTWTVWVLRVYHHRLSALFHQPWSLSADGALQLSKLSLSPLARSRWIDLHDAIEAQLGEFGELASVRPSGSKAADNLLRVAGNLAVVEESSVVEVDHIQRASALVGYYLTEIQRLTEQEPMCRVKEEADRLLRWLQVKDWKRFSIRDLNRNGPRFARISSRHATKLLVEWLITDGHTFEVRHV